MLGSIGKQSGKSVESVLCICLCMLCISLRAYLMNCMSPIFSCLLSVAVARSDAAICYILPVLYDVIFAHNGSHEGMSNLLQRLSNFITSSCAGRCRFGCAVS